jgi:acyl-homoserine lactone acylase PvdQ
MGKTKHLVFGITAHLADVSDLYKEKLSDNKYQYFLDGEWK